MSIHAIEISQGVVMQDWSLIISVAVTLGTLFAIRRWAANRTHLRAGIVLFLVGLPTFLIARKVGETDAVQSDALIWPMILIPASILVLGMALLVRGAFGASRNAARQRRSG
ncbi:hypothetical protein ASE77_17340 [Sphingomonas sp. Leaf226]|nr:hypothetical protein ASE77_17340 [Sphingomonas sp. Leaf226]